MTPHDEAFVRRIVDSPGDDAPRLVYADWLDDRGDPRGAYLRAEVETPEADRLVSLAAGLDPVWVARVSRPPAGVCLEHVSFEAGEVRHGQALTPDDISAFERRHGVSLPPEYRAFLLNWNGGSLIDCEVAFANTGADDGFSGTASDVADFMTLRPVRGTQSVDDDRETVQEEVSFHPYTGCNRLRVADAGIEGTQGYYLALTGDAQGRVFFYDKHLDVDDPLVAMTFSAFLAAIRHRA